MKFLAVLVGVIALSVNGFPGEKAKLNESNGEKAKCLVRLFIATTWEDPRFLKWFVEVGKVAPYFVKHVLRCEYLVGEEQQECYEQVKERAMEEFAHLIELLPDNIRKPFYNHFMKCIGMDAKFDLADDTLASFPEIQIPITDEVYVCVFNLFEDMAVKNPELIKWVVDATTTVIILADHVKQCSSLSDDQQTNCYEELKQLAFEEYDRLINLLPANVQTDFQQQFEKCFESQKDIFERVIYL